MMETPDSLYKAFLSHDPRFDGVFYIGVVTTGIYCRPICPVSPPKLKNCRFFSSAAAAEKAGLRPCLRCRPELAPGNAPVDDSHRIALLIAQRLEEGAISGDAGIEEIAAQFDLSARQIRRIVQKELGVSPIELLQTRRLLLAKQLLTDTRLPITEIAFASGFSSLRRFNDAFAKHYRLAPRQLRKTASTAGAARSDSVISIYLFYRPPYDWAGTLAFLRTRAIPGVEDVTEDYYARTAEIGRHRGWVMVRHAPKRQALAVEFSQGLLPVLPLLVRRLRNLFDLDANSEVVAQHLRQDKLLAPLVARHPGLRVPGCFEGFELAARAILGQHVSTKTAARFAATFGFSVETPFPALYRLTPKARDVVIAPAATLKTMGITAARAASLISLAKACAEKRLSLEPAPQQEQVLAKLMATIGISPSTAQYIAMRALRWPDVFPKEDLVLRRLIGATTAKSAEARTAEWRPWRSYAALHLWRHAASEAS